MKAHITRAQSQEFAGDKTIYHYTSIYTCIEHIFPNEKLRLSPVTSATDPMEQVPPIPSISSYGYKEDFLRLEKIDGHGIAKKVNEYYKSLRQLCFCKNSEFDPTVQYNGVFSPIDHFGFAKPRMWDQYGNNFKGVCLALSREKLIKTLPQNFQLLDIEYSGNINFRPNIDKESIDLNEVERIGKEEYLQLKYEQELKKIGHKHNDYKDENECKVITTTTDKYAYFGFRDCIQGIFFSNGLKFIYIEILKNIAEKYKIPLLQVSFRRSGLYVLPIATPQ